jgi:hypothetical protein
LGKLWIQSFPIYIFIMKALLHILLIVIAITANAQLPKDIINQNCYDSGWPDIAKDMLITENAIYFLGDQNTDDNHDDIVLFKTNFNGDLIWVKAYGGSSIDQSLSIIQDNEGFLYFSSGTFSDDGDVQSGNLGGLDSWVVKLDTSGTIIWEKTFGGTANDWGVYLLYLENGNILVYGSTHSSDINVDMNYGGLDFWVFEITVDGEILNSKVFGSTGDENIFSLIQTIDGGFFTAARAGASDGIVNGNYQGNEDMWLLKLDANLNIEWQKLIGGSQYDTGGLGISVLNDGGFIINGLTDSSDGDVHGFDFPDIVQPDLWVVRIDSIGNIIWDIALGGDNFEYSSKVFPNQDGTFTVFGSSKSMNNGDVEGHHYYVYNPTYPGFDIWMVHLSENGEFLDQRCFGNAANNNIYRGIIKISDSHYLLAGTGVSRQADPNSPEAPTEGEVWCGWESTSKDIWFFEIVDCEYFQPEIPANITGEDTICTLYTNQSTYATQIVNPQYELAQWLLQPLEAGELTNLQDSAIIQWNSDFEGQVELSVRSTSNCGESAYTELFIVTVNLQPETPAYITGQDSICTLNTSSTTYYSQLSNPQYEQAEWLLQPSQAGELTNLQDSAIIQWASDFEGQVELRVRSTSSCGESEYSEAKLIEVRSCVGIGELQAKELKIYPNPANTQITFELPTVSKASNLHIKDIFGNTIEELAIAKGQTQLIWDCSRVSSGVYFYHCEIEERIYRGKLVVN